MLMPNSTFLEILGRGALSQTWRRHRNEEHLHQPELLAMEASIIFVIIQKFLFVIAAIFHETESYNDLEKRKVYSYHRTHYPFFSLRCHFKTRRYTIQREVSQCQKKAISPESLHFVNSGVEHRIPSERILPRRLT